jgi:hypothetical protein
MNLKNKKQQKKFEHNLIEQGVISKEPINTIEDRYCILLDCDGKEITSIKFYKLNRLKDLIKGKGKIVLNDFMKRQQGMVASILQNLPIGNKVMEIK